MTPLIDASRQEHLTVQETINGTRGSANNPAAPGQSVSSKSNWLQTVRAAKAVATPGLLLFVFFMLVALTPISIIILTKTSYYNNYTYAGTLELIGWGITIGLSLPSIEPPLLLAGATSREIWRIAMVIACAATALTALGMGCCAILDIATGRTEVFGVYMIRHTGIGPSLWFLVPLGTFPGVLASACVSMANRYLDLRRTAAIVTPTILLMNPISFLIIPHALRTGLLGYVVYLLAAALAYPFLLRFILSRPRNEE